MRRFYDGYLVLTYFEKVNECFITQYKPEQYGLPLQSLFESKCRLQMVSILVKLGVI
jgi:hypothetical protein